MILVPDAGPSPVILRAGMLIKAALLTASREEFAVLFGTVLLTKYTHWYTVYISRRMYLSDVLPFPPVWLLLIDNITV